MKHCRARRQGLGHCYRGVWGTHNGASLEHACFECGQISRKCVAPSTSSYLNFYRTISVSFPRIWCRYAAAKLTALEVECHRPTSVTT